MAQKDHELLANLKATMEQETSAANITASGIHDSALVNALIKQGIHLKDLPVLHLVPLFQVAWSDGEIQAEELALLTAAAKEANLEPGSHAFELFETMLVSPPSKELYTTALTYIHLILSTLPDADADAKRSNLTDLAASIAKASGKLLGVFGTGIQSEENDVLKVIAGRLQERA
jgi:hypothetical protein